MADGESRAKAAREWVAGLLLPVTIFAYTLQKDKADDQQRELDRITAIIRSLGSTSLEERALARSYVEYLAQTRQAPAEVVTLLSSSIATAPTATESAAAARTLAIVQQTDAKLAPLATNAVKDLPFRLYLQVREGDRSAGEQVRKLLSASDLTVPGIEVVKTGPDTSEIRYFHAADGAKAEELARKLTSSGIKTVAKDASGFARSIKTNVAEKQLELWLAPGGALTPPA